MTDNATISPQRCLIVDDDEADRAILVKMLADAFPGMAVVQAATAAEAETALKTETADCLLLDYRLPDADGLAFGGRLLAAYPHLAIVLITGFGDEMLAAQAIRAGLADYIPKARITPSSLRRTVAHAVQIARQERTIAEQKNELENFAFALAHDFKQPARQIVTFVDLLAQELKDVRPGDSGKYLDFLRSAATRLSRLVDVMAQYTLLGKPPALGPVDLAAAVREATDAVSQYLVERHARVETGPLPVVRGNDTLMQQAMQNLIVNAVKYNKSETPLVRIAAACENDRVLISVTDNGIGIEAQYLAEIFNPLKRLHTAAEYPGTGLGLTLTRKAIANQGGRIWCESRPGQGSTFYIALPAEEEKSAAAFRFSPRDENAQGSTAP